MQFYWNFRETMATINALIDLKITHPEPVLGNPEPIFPKEMQ
jgi:vancomycin permeability regulator SanA